MYTVTVKIAARGAIYHEDGTSATGDMWYSIFSRSTSRMFFFLSFLTYTTFEFSLEVMYRSTSKAD